MIYNIDKDNINFSKYNIEIGDFISVYIKILDISKEKKKRIQMFQGICIAIKGSGISKTFTIRRVDFKGCVEKIFPLFSPHIDKIVIKYKSKVRRAKLYYLRYIFGKKAKIQKLNK